MNSHPSTEEQVFRLPAAQELLEARREIERLRAVLKPFAEAADAGQRAWNAFESAKLGVMDCRDVFMQFAASRVSVANFQNAKIALENPLG